MSDPTGERLQAIQQELGSILEERMAELSETLRKTETVTRRIVSAEFEIERHRATRATLESEIGPLQSEVASAKGRVDEIQEKHGELLADRDRLRGEIKRLEEEAREADAEVERTRQRVQGLEGEADSLRSENASLKTKLKTLEENIARMRRLKEELMSSISGLTQQMTGLAGGTSE